MPVKPGAPLPPRRDLFCAMQFNSIDFLIYFPIVTLLYFLLPQKIKWVWLLACSVYFYMCWKAKYIILIGFSILVTYTGSLLIQH